MTPSTRLKRLTGLVIACGLTALIGCDSNTTGETAEALQHDVAETTQLLSEPEQNVFWKSDGDHRFSTARHVGGLAARTEPGRLTLHAKNSKNRWAVAIDWIGLKVDESPLTIDPVYETTLESDTVTYHRGPIEEWYKNKIGIEHGFVLERPLSENSRVVSLNFELDEGRIESVSPDVFHIITSRDDTLRYDNLLVTDATGRELKAEIKLDSDSRFTLEAHVEGAVYPVVIDPTYQVATTTVDEPFDGGGPAAHNRFGSSLLFANGWLFATASGSDFHGPSDGIIYAYNIPAGFFSFAASPQILPHTDPTGGAQQLSYKLVWRGPLLFAGAPNDDRNTDDMAGGAIITYYYDGTTWVQHQELFENPRGEENRFGRDFSTGITQLAGISTERLTIFRRPAVVALPARPEYTETASFGLTAPETYLAVAATGDDIVAYSTYTSGVEESDLRVLYDTGGDNWVAGSITGALENGAAPRLLQFSPNGNLLVAAQSVPGLVGLPQGISFYDRTAADSWGLTRRKEGPSDFTFPLTDFFGVSALLVVNEDLVLASNPFDEVVYRFERNEGGANNWGVSKVYTGGSWIGSIAYDPSKDDVFIGSPNADTFGTSSGQVRAFQSCSGTEICDGIDNDCDGIIDEDPASASCAAGETCSYGECFDECVVSADCMGTLVCYGDSFRCDDPDDPCASLTCPSGDICVGGACFTECSSDAMCDPLNEACYQSGRCVEDDDPCDGVQCPVEQICAGGSCFDPCADAGDCTPPEICWDGRCTVDACDGIDCPIGQICVGGSCFDPCAGNDDCTPPQMCWNGEYCAVSPCDGITCPTGQTCVGGECFDPCADNDDCTPPQLCWNGDYCADDPCDGIACSEGQICVGGGCFDPCAGTDDCTPPQQCWKSEFCAVDPCEGVVCSSGQTCVQGECFDDCTDDDDCDPNSMCYRDACVVEDCSMVDCPDGWSCHLGVCFQDCTGDADCDDPDDRCWDSRCALGPCEALAQSVIDTYEAASIVKEHDRVVLAYQDSTPWLYPRPERGTNFSGFANVTGGVSNAPVHASYRARVVLYYDESIGDGSYIVWFTHGNGSGQPAAEVAYTIRGTGDTEGEVVFVDDTATHQKENDDDDWFIQTMVSTSSNETGGIAIGELPADEAWSIRIVGAFSDAVTEWEFWDAESNSVTRLNKNETLVIKSVDWPSDRPFTPTTGQTCEVEGQLGNCNLGTRRECRNGWIQCEQTVLPNAEICDGLDNDCDGDIDNFDDDLVVPQVSIRQDGLFGWRDFITYDRFNSIDVTMDYEAVSGSNGIRGSSRPVTREGGPMQTERFSATVFAHRNLATGDLDIAWIAGDTALTADGSNYPLIWEIRAFGPSTFDDFGISWFEDRDQSSGEYIVDDLDNDDREFEIRHKLENRSGRSETESDALRMLWNTGDIFARIKLDSNDEGDDDNFNLAYYEPGTGKTNLVDHRAIRVRVRGLPIEDSVCAANSLTGMGCGLSRYQCVGGSLQCGAAEDTVCNVGCIDNDGDGYGAPGSTGCSNSEVDCDDDDPNVHPGAPELCNGIDNDCDGVPDSTTVGCPGGMGTCGPAECSFTLSCICPDGPEYSFDPPDEPCVCGSGLDP